jgi:hypothetical protein
MLNDEIKKKLIKNDLKITQVNISNLRLGS